jgi:hypothetical protein
VRAGRGEMIGEPMQPILPTVPSPPIIVQDDFGRFRLDPHDTETPGFESRSFAEAVLVARTRFKGRRQ